MMLIHLMTHAFILAATIGLLSPAAIGSDIWFVNEAAGGAATGQSWLDAFTDLQAALAVADSGDQVWVAAGNYRPDEAGLDPTAVFSIPAGVAVYGGFAGDEVALSQRQPASNMTTLDGDLLQNDVNPGFINSSDNSYRVILIQGGSDPARLDGVTVRGGRGSTQIPLFFHSGGITIEASTAVISSCTVEWNRTPVITGAGGGMSVLEASDVTVMGCLFFGNFTKGNGGAFRVAPGARATAINCRLVGNKSSNGGGAVDFFNASGRLVNCLIAGNESSGSGGGLQVWGSDVPIIHCTIAANQCGPNGGGAGIATVDPGQVQIANSILWGNVDPSIAIPGTEQVFADAQTLLSSCCLQPPQVAFVSGTDLIYSDPLFVDPVGPDLVAGSLDDDYRLTSASPCIDAGSNQLFAPDALDLDCDGNLTEPLPVDGLLVPRYVDQPTVLDQGVGPPPIADIGAYEYSGWTNLGHALQGTGGLVPCATGGGDWIPGRDISLELRRGPPGALAAVVLSSSIAKLPFRGGVLVPAPEEAFVTILDGQGHALLSDAVPTEQPLGSLIVLQAWFLDPGAPFGASAAPAFSGLVHP